MSAESSGGGEAVNDLLNAYGVNLNFTSVYCLV